MIRSYCFLCVLDLIIIIEFKTFIFSLSRKSCLHLFYANGSF